MSSKVTRAQKDMSCRMSDRVMPNFFQISYIVGKTSIDQGM